MSDEPASEVPPPNDLDPEDLEPASHDPVPGSLPSPIDDDREHAVRGSRWGILSGLVEQVGSIAVTVVLARLLTPADIGVVAAATLLVSLMVMVGHVGLGASLVKRRSIEEPVASTTFWAATSLGLLLSLVLAATAPLLAAALGTPAITPYVVGLSPLLAVTMVSNVSEGRLLRELRFRWVYTADIANVAVYAVVTLALAGAGAGAWSMVVGRLAGEAVATTIRLVAARWRPRLLWDWSVIREDLSFNRSFLAMMSASYVVKNLDYWAVSRNLGSTSLGIYYVAFVLPTILRQRMTWLATEILMPLMARAADDRTRLEGIYRSSMEVLCVAAFPLLTGVALTAGPLIRIAFGDQWTAAVGPLRILAAAAAIEVTTNTAVAMFLALDRADIPSKTMQLRLAALVVGLAIATRGETSLDAVAAAVAVATLVSTVIPHRAVSRAVGIPFRRVARWLVPSLVADAAMVAVVVAVAAAVPAERVVLQALAMTTSGAVTYLAVLWAVDRPLARRLLALVRSLVRPGAQLSPAPSPVER